VTAREGPPEKERPDGSQAARPIQKSGPHQTHQPRPAYIRGHRQPRYADAWRRGFAQGFKDSLRLAARRLPAEYWQLLDDLASEFELASCDG